MRRIDRWAVCLLAVLIFSGCSGKERQSFDAAQQNLDKGNYEEALTGFQDAVSLGAHLAESYRGQGIACLELGRYEEAVEAFVLAAGELDEGRNKALLRDIYLYKATAEYKMGDMDAALADCMTAREMGDDAQASLLMGKFWLEQADYGQAGEAFRDAIAADDSYEMYINIYQIYMQKNMAADGEVFLKEALEKGGSGEDDYFQRGRIYFFMGDNENAKKELIEASNKDSGEAMLLLGKVYLSENNTANARAMYQQYMDSGKGKAGGCNGLALCDIADGNYDSALEQIHAGLEAAETAEVGELLFNEAVVYERKMDFATAKQKFEEYLRLFPDDAAAEKEYQFLLNRQ